MNDTINSSLTSLKIKKDELEAELSRINQAIEALENLGGVAAPTSKKKSNRRGHRLTCQNKDCNKMFYAKRRDAKYCNPGHAPAYIKRLKNPERSKIKPIILIKGDPLKAK